MTIKERFAKYTTEEIIEGIAKLKAKIADDEACMAMFKAEGNVEMFRMAKDLRDDRIDKLMDAECALKARQ